MVGLGGLRSSSGVMCGARIPRSLARRQYPERMVYVVAVVVGALFGGADQWLGSIALPWVASVSLLSAPWLILPFCFGCSQRIPKSAVLVGLLATYAALVGYGAMTLSPMEGVHLSQQHEAILGLLRSERLVVIGGLLSGPLYGFLGYCWRVRRAWVSGVLVAGAVCLEPLAERVAGRLPEHPVVWQVEVAVGLVLAGYFAVAAYAARRQSASAGRFGQP
jgi:hypothetical protein